jgi:hypothetical protein
MWLLVPLLAWADPCSEAVELAARGVPASGIASALAEVAWSPADVTCLVEHAVPDRVVRLASRRADVPLPPDGRTRRWAVAIGSAYLPALRVETPALVGLELGWSPASALTLALRGDVGITPVEPFTRQLIPSFDAAPEPLIVEDRVRESAAFTVAFAPLTGTVHAGRATLALRGFARLGAGAIHTADDPWFATVTDDLDQVHPTLTGGAGFEVHGPRALGVRIAGDLTRWVETYDDTALVNRGFGALSAQLVLRP